AARTLGLDRATALPLHAYIAIAAVLIGVVAATIGVAAPYVAAPLVVAAVAPVVAATAWLNPGTEARGAALGPLALAIGVVVERALQPAGSRAWYARGASAGLTGALTLLSLFAAT